MLKAASAVRLAKIAQGFTQSGEPLGMETAETPRQPIPALDCLHGEKVSPSIHTYSLPNIQIILHCLLSKSSLTSTHAKKLYIM